MYKFSNWHNYDRIKAMLGYMYSVIMIIVLHSEWGCWEKEFQQQLYKSLEMYWNIKHHFLKGWCFDNGGGECCLNTSLSFGV